LWYLIGDDYRRSRQIAEDVAGMVGGILSLSAALPGRRTLAVFPAGMARLSEVSTRVAGAPLRLASFRSAIRWVRAS
jgi:hypothetical protein